MKNKRTKKDMTAHEILGAIADYKSKGGKTWAGFSNWLENNK